MKNRRNYHVILGYLFAMGATAIWSGNFIVARGLKESIPPISLAFWRWIVAIIVSLPFAVKPLIEERFILKQHIPYLCVTALLGITTFNTLVYLAGHTSTAINLSLISISFPIYIVILSRFVFHEMITLKKCIGIMLVVAGVVILITKGVPSSLLKLSFAVGDMWMLLAALSFAVYSILLKQKPDQLSIWAFHLCTFILGTIFLFPLFVWEYVSSPAISFGLESFLSILYVGIFASLVAFILWNKAILAIGPSKAGMVYYTLPIFSGFAAYLLLKESISIIHICSMLMIVLGIITANYEPSIISKKRVDDL